MEYEKGRIQIKQVNYFYCHNKTMHCLLKHMNSISVNLH
ncbi:MAG: hypothetical protein RLZZ28_1782 [Bacteroidota bacterium]|jgi:hypothetical protein